MRIEHSTTHFHQHPSPHAVPHKGKIKPDADYNNVCRSADKNITNINRPAKSVNFSGSVSSKAKAIQETVHPIAQKAINGAIVQIAQENGKSFKKVPQWAQSFLESKGVNKALKLVKDNEALFEGIITLGLAGLLKPICVLAMPGSEEKDKQAQATKNFVAAITGFVLGTIILTPISKGVKKITKNPAKYIKDPNYIKFINPKTDGVLADAYSTFYKKVADMGIAPMKAAITLAFMPYVLDFLFKSKNEKKDAAKRAAMEKNAQTPDFKLKLNDSEQVFKQMSGGLAK